MTSASDDIPLSALQHWLYCPRQYALIHIERIWAENTFTAEGRLLHERADLGRPESRPGIRMLRGVEIRSDRFGLHGVADVVELRGGRPYPVEYKRGKPKTHRADEVQLCAQALCLEEIFACNIPEGALFYGQTRRRSLVPFDAELRALTLSVADAVRACRDAGTLPTPGYKAERCDRCSLLQDCLPQIAARSQTVARWLERAIATQGVPE
ncbi:CRISPR-associated protein Cas4 [Roseinatronobacter thiooxidans]|nr:CRISPR-associated protein Cas4 [Roseinatronobacter thiooxidans]